MATKAQEVSLDAVEELLDTVDKTMERLKTLYEQYFLGIQKQAPAHIHSDIERKLRDLTQMNIRNTGLRYRLATLQQKFGSYNSYWRRTLRQIENGTYARNLSKIGRQAARTGADIPEEILAAMPKRMRDQVLRDREQALAAARRRDQTAADEEPVQELEADFGPPSADELAAVISEPTALRRELRGNGGAHILQDEGDLDFDAFFKSVSEDTQPAPAPQPVVAKPPASLRAASITSSPIAAPRAPAPPPPPMRAATPPPVPRADTLRDEPAVAQRQTGPVPAQRQTGPVPAMPGQRQTGPVQAIPGQRQTGPVPAMPGQRQTGPVPAVSASQTGAVPTIPASTAPSGPIPRPIAAAPSQSTRPNPIVPGAAAARGPVAVESMNGPFPRVPTSPTATQPSLPKAPLVASPTQTQPSARPPQMTTQPSARPPQATAQTQPSARPSVPSPTQTQPSARPPQTQPSARPQPKPEAPLKPPAGMSDADVNALYAKYVQAKQMVGEAAGPGARDKLLKTINAQAPKIMEQYKAKGVDFSVVVKDNQVIIRAKPKG